MDFPVNTLLSLIPQDIVPLVEEYLGIVSLQHPSTDKEIQWMLSVRRTLAIMYTNDTICNIEYYSIAPDGRLNINPNYPDTISKDSYVTCRRENEATVVSLEDSPIETSGEILERIINPFNSRYIIEYKSDIEYILPNRRIFDIRTVFMIFYRRIQSQKKFSVDKCREMVRGRIIKHIHEVRDLFVKTPYLYEMYLSMNIVNMEIGYTVIYENLSDEKVLDKCDEYYSLLEEEVAHMR